MDHDHQLSRVKKYQKRRSVMRSITIFSILGVLLLFGLIFMLFWGNDEEPDALNDPSGVEESLASEDQLEQEASDHDDDVTEASVSDDSESEQADDSVDPNEHTEGEKEQTEQMVDNQSVEVNAVSTDDPNVIEALEGEWQPVGTTQEEPHTVQFNQESVDWKEMVTAIETVVSIDDMLIHWIGNGGDQKAIATVSTPDHSEIYRVFLSWVPHKGWQPTRLEQLERVEIIK
ncbi:MAG TPA: DUF1510 family protein [Bacillota bacterium]|nr:DUF1510 family protein [Bacillota bacterium]